MTTPLRKAVERFKDIYLGKYGVIGVGEGENAIDVLLDDGNEREKIENPFLGHRVAMTMRSETRHRNKRTE